MREVRLDLFKLHDENDKGLGRIRIEKNPQFLKNFNQLLEEIRSVTKMSNNSICKKLNCSLDLLFHYKNDRKVPLGILIKLINLWKISLSKTEEEYEKRIVEIQDSILEVSHSSGRLLRKTKCPKGLSLNLCKLAGDIVADGNLQLTKNAFGCAYEVRIWDQYKDNLDNFCSLIYSEFGIKREPKFDIKENYWYAKYGNKVILRYFSKIFGIPIGDKSAIVKMPDIIKTSSIEHQIAFINGVIMFDGGIHFAQPRFSLGTKSKLLYNDIKRVLNALNLQPDYTNEKIIDYKDVFSIEIWNKGKLKIILKTFIEPNTIKWKQLNYLINGLDFTPKNLDDAIAILSTIYPKARKSAITFKDVIKTLGNRGGTTTKDMSKEFNVDPKVIFNYLKGLEEWNILTSVVRKETSPNKAYKIWSINPNLKQN